MDKIPPFYTLDNNRKLIIPFSIANKICEIYRLTIEEVDRGYYISYPIDSMNNKFEEIRLRK